MAQITSTLLLSQQAFDGSTATSTGDAVKANGYYGQADGKHTVQFSLSNFVGKIRIEGTLATTPASTDWAVVNLGTGVTAFTFDTTGAVSETAITFLEYDTATSTNVSYNFMGNFTFVRAYVYDWTAGTVNSIRVNY